MGGPLGQWFKLSAIRTTQVAGVPIELPAVVDRF
jgi:hypothetical protein